MNPWDQFITEHEVLQAHAEGIHRHGEGDLTPPKLGCLHQCLGNAYQASVYSCQDESEYLLSFAAHLLLYLDRNQCFKNGNKRAAWLSCMRVFARLGLTIRATDDEAKNFGLAIANRGITDGMEIANWLASRLIAMEDYEPQ